MRMRSYLGGVLTIGEYITIFPMIAIVLLGVFTLTGQIAWEITLVFVLYQIDGVRLNTFNLLKGGKDVPQ